MADESEGAASVSALRSRFEALHSGSSSPPSPRTQGSIEKGRESSPTYERTLLSPEGPRSQQAPTSLGKKPPPPKPASKSRSSDYAVPANAEVTSQAGSTTEATPGKKRPPPPPPSLGGRPAIAVSNPSADNVPKAPPPIPSNKPRSNGLTTSQNAPLHTNRSFSATQYPKSAPTSPFRQPSDPVDDFHPYSHSPAPPVPLLPPRTGTASVPVSRAPSPSYPPASFASTSRTSHRSTSSLASAGSADDVPHYRPPPPIPIRTNSIAGKGHPSSDEATYDHASSATRSSRSASEGPLPPFRQSESFPPPPPTRTSSIRPPPSRNIARGEKVAPVKPAVATKSANLDGSESDAGDEDPSSLAKLADSVPDASLASRRPPTFTPDGAHVRFVTTARFTCAVVRRSWLVVGSAHHVRVFDLDLKTTVISVPVSAEATKVTALNFRTSTTDDDNGTIIWAGTKDGNLVEVDLTSGTILSSRSNIHPGAVTRVDRTPQGMVTMGEGGKLAFWVNDPTHGYPLLNFQATESRRLHEDSPFAELIHGNIWTSAGPSSKSELRTPSIRVYNPKAIPSFDLTPRPLLLPDTGSVAAPSAVSCACTVPGNPGLVYMGHESGHISVWNESSFSFEFSIRAATACVTAMVGVDRYLWCGFKSGKIQIFDTSSNPWTMIVSFKSHNDSVAKLMVNPKMLWETDELPVVSLSSEGEVCVWDGLLSQWFLDKEMTVKEPQYSSYRPVNCLVCSWNVDAAKPSALEDSPSNNAFLQDCLQTADDPAVIVFSFQELIDLENKTLAAKSFIFGRKKGEKNMQEAVSHHYPLWRDRLTRAIRTAMPANAPYSLVHAEVLVGLFTCVFVKDSEKSNLRDLDICQVKTGLSGRFGNKGSIVARMVIDDTSVCFANCHLAAGQSHVRQRNKDLIEILDSGDALPAVAEFAPNAYIGGGDGSMVFDHNVVILSGDLNYRIDLRRDFVIQQAQQGRFEQLWEHDQLVKQIRSNPQHRLRSFTESKLEFAPTYKYDRGSNDYDTSEKARCPAWCDRILWRSVETGSEANNVQALDFRRYEVDVSDHRPISAVLQLPIRREESGLRKEVLEAAQSTWMQVKRKTVAGAKAYFGLHAYA